MERNQFKEHFLEKSDCHKSAAWIKTNYFLIESSSAKGKFSMETLVEGIKPLASEKNEFDYRDKSILISFF